MNEAEEAERRETEGFCQSNSLGKIPMLKEKDWLEATSHLPSPHHHLAFQTDACMPSEKKIKRFSKLLEIWCIQLATTVNSLH